VLGIKLLPGLQDNERAIYAVHDPFFVMPVGVVDVRCPHL
jgi:hypothetical protein